MTGAYTTHESEAKAELNEISRISHICGTGVWAWKNGDSEAQHAQKAAPAQDF